MARIQITQAVADGYGPVTRLSSQIGGLLGLFPTPVAATLVDVELADDGRSVTITVETLEDIDCIPTAEGMRRKQYRRHLSAVPTDVETKG